MSLPRRRVFQDWFSAKHVPPSAEDVAVWAQAVFDGGWIAQKISTEGTFQKQYTHCTSVNPEYWIEVKYNEEWYYLLFRAPNVGESYLQRVSKRARVMATSSGVREFPGHQTASMLDLSPAFKGRSSNHSPSGSNAALATTPGALGGGGSVGGGDKRNGGGTPTTITTSPAAPGMGVATANGNGRRPPTGHTTTTPNNQHLNQQHNLNHGVAVAHQTTPHTPYAASLHHQHTASLNKVRILQSGTMTEERTKVIADWFSNKRAEPSCIDAAVWCKAVFGGEWCAHMLTQDVPSDRSSTYYSFTDYDYWIELGYNSEWNFLLFKVSD